MDIADGAGELGGSLGDVAIARLSRGCEVEKHHRAV